jgi:hypothetical protein
VCQPRRTGMTSPGKTREYGECEDDYCERNRYRKPQPSQSSLFVIPFFHEILASSESTMRLAPKCGAVKEMQAAPAFPARRRFSFALATPSALRVS